MSCPVLKTLVREGWLQPTPEGIISEEELHTALRDLGLDQVTTEGLMVASRATGATEDGRLDLGSILQSRLQHNADFYRSGRLDELLQGRPFVSSEELGQAACQRAREDPGLHGRLQGGAELVALITVFGRRQEDRLVLTRQDLEDLYIHHRFPVDWEPKRPRMRRAPVEGLKFMAGQVLEAVRDANPFRKPT